MKHNIAGRQFGWVERWAGIYLLRCVIIILVISTDYVEDRKKFNLLTELLR